MQYLIVNADDFGLHREVNRGVLEAFTRGVVTNASLIVNEEGSEDAVRRAKKAKLPLGLHLNFFSGSFTHAKSLFGPNGKLRFALYSREERRKGDVSFSRKELAALDRECTRQLERFQELVGTHPNHLSYHFGLHYLPSVFASYARFAHETNLPFRGKNLAATPLPHYDRVARWFDDFHEPRTAPGDFLSLLDALGDGITEVSVHPGFGTPEREEETATLCDAVVKRGIAEHGVTLTSYSRFSQTAFFVEGL